MSNPLPSVPPMASPPTVIPVDSSSGLWDRITTWAADNKAVVYTAAGVAVVATGAGVIYFLNSDSKKESTPKLSKKERRKRKEAERKAAETEKQPTSTEAAAPTQPKAAAVESADELPEIDETTVASFTADQRERYAAKLKDVGNQAYGSKDYNKAIELYSKAILCKANPIFYSNRAACYNALGNWDKVVEDTTAAINLDPEYVKALNRRANAYEHLKMYSEALLDFTASCIIDSFKNESSAQAVERLLKKFAEQKAQEMMADRPSKLPSHTFVGNYLQSFRVKPRPAGLEDSAILSEDTGKGQLQLGLRALEKKTGDGYEEARAAFEKALELGELGEFEALAYNLRGTFSCLLGKHDDAMADLSKSIELDPSMTQSYIKRASMNLELGAPEKAAEDFEKAMEHNSEDPDIYYHRAQLHFIKGEFSDAAKDYQKSIDLDRDFIFSHIQLGVTQYKMGSIASSMSTFRRCIKNFKEVPDVYNYYGELLLDQGNFQEAIEKFDSAIDMESKTKPMAMNVLPLINKALTLFQWKQDFGEAEKLCQKALISK
ncbi:import receptor [Colletotrichum graminicola]|nr:import receptor [Colletotrichum graminicola]